MREFIRRVLRGLNTNTANSPYNRYTQVLQAAEYARLQERVAEKTPENLALQGYKVYSQQDEDGIINAIFKRIPHNGTFVEIGLQDGTECNSLNLLLNGWKGIWVEGDPAQVSRISKSIGTTEAPGILKVINTFVDRESILQVCKESLAFVKSGTLDFFSMDIDGNDYYLVEEMLKGDFKPSVFCVEYNGRFPVGMNVKIKYNREHLWDMTEYMGASLSAYTDLMGRHGYTLLCCNVVGVNAFFIRNEFAGHFKIYSESELYQPARHYLSPMMHGHPPSLRFLRDRIESQTSKGS
jgi:hypothetical protein